MPNIVKVQLVNADGNVVDPNDPLPTTGGGGTGSAGGLVFTGTTLPTLTPGDIKPLNQTQLGQLAVVPTDVNGVFPDFTAPVAIYAGYPQGATILQASSGNVANASAAATLGAASSKLTYITGFTVTAGGATAAALVNGTITGLIGGTRTFTYGAPAGVAVLATPLTVNFNPPIPANATNVAIVVTVPALGSGNTNAAVSAQGYRV